MICEEASGDERSQFDALSAHYANGSINGSINGSRAAIDHKSYYLKGRV